MKRLLSSTTALALVLTSIPAAPLWAQTLDADGRVVLSDGTVVCTPTETSPPCDPAAFAAEAAALDAARAAAEAAAAEAERAAAEAAAAEAERAAAEAAAEAERAAAEAAATEAERAATEAAAAEAERAATEAAAAEAERAAAEAAAAEAERAAAEAAATEAERAAAEAAAAEAERAAAEAAAAEAERAAAEAAAAEAERAAAEAAAAESARAAAEAATAPSAAPVERPDVASQPPAETPAVTATETPAATPTEAPDVASQPPAETPADTPAAVPAETAVTAAEPAPEPLVVPPEPAPEAVSTLENLLAPTDPAATEAPPAAAAMVDPGVPASATTEPATAPLATTTATITEADTRSSAEEFTAAPQVNDDGRRGLSNFEKVGLVALGALVVGAILKNGDTVEQNTGDRVVVRRDDGSLSLLKDDDVLLRRPGSDVQTQTFRDGSTRTIVDRSDGSQIITIRDASGRVLRRARVDLDGRETLLIDDTAPVRPVDLASLPRPVAPVVISTSDGNAQLAAELAALSAREAGRSFSLRQIRDLREVRALAPAVDVAPITFATGASAIAPSEAAKLAALGRFIAESIRLRPNELFLIEGHTDAVGSDTANLTLSDRRAESLALALTEYFGVPPENLVVQGYGESDLLVPVATDEPRNRRVAVRMLSPLLTAAR